MRALATLLIALFPGIATAHPGHLAEVAGHDHVVAGIAVGVAIGVAIWGALTGNRDEDDEDDAETVEDGELQEA